MIRGFRITGLQDYRSLLADLLQRGYCHVVSVVSTAHVIGLELCMYHDRIITLQVKAFSLLAARLWEGCHTTSWKSMVMAPEETTLQTLRSLTYFMYGMTVMSRTCKTTNMFVVKSGLQNEQRDSQVRCADTIPGRAGPDITTVA